MRAFYSYGIAGVIVLVIAAWLVTGTFVAGGNGPGNGEKPIIAMLGGDEGGEHAEASHSEGTGEEIDPHLTIAERLAQAGGGDAAVRSVRTETFVMRPMAIEAPLRGKTKAKSLVSIMPETAGKVTEVHVTKGQRVEIGDKLCTLDRGTRLGSVEQAEAALAQAQAGLDQAKQQYETNKKLRNEGLAAANTAASFESALKAAQANVAAAQSAVNNANEEFGRTDVVATVSGVVQEPLATVGATLGPQVACATIVELDPMLFVGSVPEARIGLAKTGLPATITTITGQKIEGKVSYIASVADPATRSFAVEIEIPNPKGDIRDGLTAEAVVNLGTAPAHLLPQSVLTLNDDGVLGVRSVKDSVVAFNPITIVRDTREGIWVTGLPPKIDIITLGQEYVQPGQKVDATNVAATTEDTTASEGVQS